MRTVQASEAITLPQDPLTVWALVAPAESSVVLLPGRVVRAFTVAGTGPGVGEQQCHIHQDGSATIAEVVELVENRRAVTVGVFPEGRVRSRSVTSVEPSGNGCVLTLGTEREIPAHARWPRSEQDDFRRFALAYLERVKHVIDEQAADRSRSEQ